MMTRRPGGWKTRHPYLIWAYDYDVAAGGGKMLHRLCHELRAAGEDAYVVPATSAIWTVSPERGSVSGLGLATNPDWDTPVFEGELDGMWTAVYPEIVRDPDGVHLSRNGADILAARLVAGLFAGQGAEGRRAP